MELKVTVPSYDVDIADAIARRYIDNEDLDARIRERINALVDKAVGEKVRECATAAVAEILSTGWPRTNQYGETVGAPMTTRERFAEHLFGKKGGYESNADRMFREVLDSHMRAGLSKEIEDAKMRFREQVDAFLSAKITDGLRAALGLK